MSTSSNQLRGRVAPKPSNAGGHLLSGAEVKTRLHERKETLKSWALKNGYSYSTVSDVVRGKNRGTFGAGHRIAIALGMKREGA